STWRAETRSHPGQGGCLMGAKVPDLLAAAPVCSLWRRVVDSAEFWRLLGPRLRLEDRVIRRKQISERRSRGSVTKGVLLGARKEVALRVVDMASSNAGRHDGLLPSLVRE
ncbi:unnamed protein product, partial [Effrenium voratum]